MQLVIKWINDILKKDEDEMINTYIMNFKAMYEMVQNRKAAKVLCLTEKHVLICFTS